MQFDREWGERFLGGDPIHFLGVFSGESLLCWLRSFFILVILCLKLSREQRPDDFDFLLLFSEATSYTTSQLLFPSSLNRLLGTIWKLSFNERLVSLSLCELRLRALSVYQSITIYDWKKFTVLGICVESAMVMPLNSSSFCDSYMLIRDQIESSRDIILLTSFFLFYRPISSLSSTLFRRSADLISSLISRSSLLSELLSLIGS